MSWMGLNRWLIKGFGGEVGVFLAGLGLDFLGKEWKGKERFSAYLDYRDLSCLNWFLYKDMVRYATAL